MQEVGNGILFEADEVALELPERGHFDLPGARGWASHGGVDARGLIVLGSGGSESTGLLETRIARQALLRTP